MKIEQPHEQVFLYTLDNGLRVVIDERTVPYTKLSSVYGHVCVGAQDDGNNPGISHFLEHVMAKTPKTNIEEGCFEYNADTAIEATTYSYAQVLPEYQPRALDELLHKLKQPNFNRVIIEQERARIVSEFDDVMGRYQWSIVVAAKEALRGHPSTNHPLGTKDSVQKITQDDLVQHYKDYYKPSNIILSLVGDFDKEKVLSKVQETFSQADKKSSAHVMRPKIEEASVWHNTPKNQDAVIFSLAFKGSDARDSLRTQLTDKIIIEHGGARRSALYGALCNKSGLYSYNLFQNRTKYTGLTFLAFECDVEKFADISKNAAKGLRHMRSEEQYNIKATRNQARIEFELEKCFSSRFARNNAYQLMYANKIYTPWNEIETLEEITQEEVQHRARSMFSSNFATLVSCSRESISRLGHASEIRSILE